ncbi:uncharacterized membrane protein YpjA [Bacillus oleivorans]|uniref:Uncharacterized membrane protein YpjA n=1 Tax=Bacillus oleivorans TaxID=1448271 RepID=A0A285CKS2_9BACI|nr:DUF1405 domain-containing protein [Bacillus oleivorans]SNX68157.1 uncharacterized membrane protein YpjA [Bacillus oleivorans]
MFPLAMVLREKWFLWVLLIINTAGTIYGYIWYKSQLAITPGHFLIFVPDSPTASLFFCFVLVAFILGKNWGLFEALALITLYKYGIWAVVMNILTLIVSGDLHWTGYMLMASHLAMAIEGILYAPFYRIKWWHFVVAGIWTLHNDVIDYVFMMYPVYHSISMYVKEIGYFTFWLSITALFLTYILCFSKYSAQWPLKK